MNRAVCCRWLREIPRVIRLMMPLLALGWGSDVAAAPANADEVIVPNSSLSAKAPGAPAATGSGPLTAVGVLVLAGAGGWMLWRGRAAGLKQFSRMPRQLAVEETRSLGNRQYLVVATYQDKKFLIGVCPGRIDLLSNLHSSSSPVVTEKSLS
jgi:flagellar protein FliO/FliZ